MILPLVSNVFVSESFELNPGFLIYENGNMTHTYRPSNVIVKIT